MSRHKVSVLIALRGKKGFSEPAQMHRLTRAFAYPWFPIHKAHASLTCYLRIKFISIFVDKLKVIFFIHGLKYKRHCVLNFFKINFFKIFFQIHYQSKLYGSRSGPTFCIFRYRYKPTVCKTCDPPGRDHFLLQWQGLNKLCRGPLDDAIYQISRLQIFWSRASRFFSHFKPFYKM